MVDKKGVHHMNNTPKYDPWNIHAYPSSISILAQKLLNWCTLAHFWQILKKAKLHKYNYPKMLLVCVTGSDLYIFLRKGVQ